MYFPSSSASDAGKLSWCSWKSSSHTFHTSKPDTFYCQALHFLSKIVRFHILGLWKKKKKKKKKKKEDPNFWHFTVGRGGQTNIFFFFRPYKPDFLYMIRNWINIHALRPSVHKTSIVFKFYRQFNQHKLTFDKSGWSWFLTEGSRC